MADPRAPFRLSLGLGLLAALEIAAHVLDQEDAGREGERDADAVADVAAVARQIGHQFDEEDEDAARTKPRASGQ